LTRLVTGGCFPFAMFIFLRAVGFRVMESVLFGLNAGLGYLFILEGMSFNGWVFVAAVMGFVDRLFLQKL
jgi:hypothetical protein